MSKDIENTSEECILKNTGKIISCLAKNEILLLQKYLKRVYLEPGDIIVKEGESKREMYFIIYGVCKIKRATLDVGTLSEGDHFGELGLITGKPRAASITAATETLLLKLNYDTYEKMLNEAPALTVKVVQAIVSTLGSQLTEMTDSVELLLHQRSVPRNLNVEVIYNGEKHIVKTGKIVKELLPKSINDYPVVAALMNNKIVPLSTPILSNVTLDALTTNHWEGERIYRRSLTLLLLEAMSDVYPDLKLKFGVSIANSQWIKIENTNKEKNIEIVEKIKERMHELVEKDVIFRQEIWVVEEAISYFKEHGWDEAASLLLTYRSGTVPLISCGKVYTISSNPLVPFSGILKNFDVKANSNGILLIADSKIKEDKNENKVHKYKPYVKIMTDHELWLNSLGVDSVGKFNQSCIVGNVPQIIRVAEGFHEKRISHIADQISSKSDKIKIICIAGPSSSGKTTFIKRLSIQLQVNGITPLGISLDDYYLDRDKLTPDENGEYDFESLEAIDTNLLKQHLSRILTGEKIKTAKYDFKSAKNLPEGGPEIELKPKNILLMEGIHGLNPELVRDKSISNDQVFRIFIQPMTSLPMDHLSRVNPSDLRLLRRIIRDRRQRGYSVEDNIMRWSSVRDGEQKNIFPFIEYADAIFDTSLIYEISVLKVYAERYLLEVTSESPAYMTAFRLRQLIDHFVAIYPDHVPPTSILREFIGGSGFEY